MKASKLFFAALLGIFGFVPSCAPGSGGADGPVEKAQAAIIVNGDFETGAANAAPSSWLVQPYLNQGITVQSPQTRAGLKLMTGGKAITTTISGTNQPDPDLGAAASLRWCRYGNQCARVNFHSNNQNGNNNGQNVNALYQDTTIGAADVDAIDGKIHVRFVIAPVLQNFGHPAAQQPYYLVQVTNTTSGTLLYSDFNLSAQAGVPWKTINTGMTTEIEYVDWSLVDVSPDATLLAQGDKVRIEIIAGGCSIGAHFGEVYVDGFGSNVPGLYISGTGPAQANPGSLVTYNMMYKNGSAAPANGVTINLTTPLNTTFQSITAPAGATCVPPAVGSAGTITCTFAGAVAAGASGTFQVGLNLSASATGQLVLGTYDIHSNEERTLNGSKIVTTIGCSADSICGTGKWCNISGNQCTPTLDNGTGIPTDAPHTNPTLNGTCTTAAGTLVCSSTVCDTADNKCGKANGSGVCSVANQATICRSGVCDPDNSCGYATNHGPCSTGNAGTVCRSGSCSSNLLCQPAAGCNVDADCTGGKWCNETSHLCQVKLGNGTGIPSDTPHANPTLNGTCSPAAGSLVCQSLVCDTTDNKCGYDTNGGPCSTATAATVCRSTTCSANLLCRPLNGCNVDADCANNQFCTEASHVCTAKLANGVGIPTDAPHTNPTLTGKCTAPAGTLVCQASVCDAIDDKCGKLNGSGTCTTVNQATICRSGVCDAADGACGYDTNHGPCTALDAGTVCRSGTCSSNLLCEPMGGCNVDTDCASGQWCNETNHACSVKLTNGTSIPTDSPHANPTLSGTCTAPAATLVCQSAVCDALDDKCGYGTNGGPCTTANAGTVCRSGSCSVNLLCKPTAGCNVDGDCTSGNWCAETLHACTPTLANNTALPSDAPHASPTLDGTCTGAAAALVCQSQVCDAADNRCGHDNGVGPCSAANAALVCRSGACSVDLTCRPSAGCNLDADCTAGNWCEESTRSCQSKLENGTDVPTDAPHTNPTLSGKCTDAAATLVCQSAVCDTIDDQCGYADGDGPCTAQNGASVCRSATCSANGLCEPAAGCNVDADCSDGRWCNETLNTCLPKLDNGVAIPKDKPHTSPTLNGTCTDDAASLVCDNGVCDTKDDECGLANGSGPCTAANGGAVCRSGMCATTGAMKGSCVGCTEDAQCSGATPVCETKSGDCVACTKSDECSGKTPICDTEHFTCVACDGDKDSSSAHPCLGNDAPLCFKSGTNAGKCGVCATNDDCADRPGSVCDAASGLCLPGCTLDKDCSASEWCNDTTRQCTPKLANDVPLPADPGRVAICTSAVGSAVCQSALCDPADNRCGLAAGDGDCADDEQCRAGTCSLDTHQCTGAACTTDADCSAREYCSSAGSCAPLLPTGAACSASSQCQSHDCFGSVCNRLIASGSGVACSTNAPGGTNGRSTLSWFGLLLTAAAFARKRRQRAV